MSRLNAIDETCFNCLISVAFQDWLSSVAGRQAAFHGIAQYHQSLVSKDAKDFGVEIARLRVRIVSAFILNIMIIY